MLRPPALARNVSVFMKWSTKCIISQIRFHKRWPTAGAIHRAPADGLEHLAFKRRGAIHCARAGVPQYLDKLIDA